MTQQNKHLYLLVPQFVSIASCSCGGGACGSAVSSAFSPSRMYMTLLQLKHGVSDCSARRICLNLPN